jgi:hypothetical protein
MFAPTTEKESTRLHPVSTARPAGMYSGVITVSLFRDDIANPVDVSGNDRVIKT